MDQNSLASFRHHIISALEDFAQRHQMSDAGAGRRLVNDSSLLLRLRRGRSIGTRRIERLVSAMAALDAHERRRQ